MAIAASLACSCSVIPRPLGGSESYFARLSRFFVEQGDQVAVFTTTADALEAFWRPDGATLHAGCSIQDGIEVRRYPLNFRFRGRRWLLKPLMLFPHRGWQCAMLSCNPFFVVHVAARRRPPVAKQI